MKDKLEEMKRILEMSKDVIKDGQIAAKHTLMERYPDMVDLKFEADQIILLFEDGSKKQFSTFQFQAAKQKGQSLPDFVDSVERVYPVH